jgi:hypothetical protein
MPSTCFEPSDLIIPAFDHNAKTPEIVNFHLHPGQVQMINSLLDSGRYPFRDRGDIIRWSIAFGTYTLFGTLPSVFVLTEAKMAILMHECFKCQKDCLADSVSKYLARGDKEGARRVVKLSLEEYQRISHEYFRDLWMSTLHTPLEMLRQRGVEIKDIG